MTGVRTPEARHAEYLRYRERYPGRVAENSRRSYEANREARLEWQRQYREANREVLRARVAASEAKPRAAVFAHYGTACACCGTTGRLTIDHVNGGGAEHREQLFGTARKGGTPFYRWLIRQGFPDGYQVLCAACNASKQTGERCRINHRKVSQ